MESEVLVAAVKKERERGEDWGQVAIPFPRFYCPIPTCTGLKMFTLVLHNIPYKNKSNQGK